MVDQKKSEPDQKFPETEQIFFWSTKKMRNRPDNWSTKRLTKTTWTGLNNTVKSRFIGVGFKPRPITKQLGTQHVIDRLQLQIYTNIGIRGQAFGAYFPKNYASFAIFMKYRLQQSLG